MILARKLIFLLYTVLKFDINIVILIITAERKTIICRYLLAENFSINSESIICIFFILIINITITSTIILAINDIYQHSLIAIPSERNKIAIDDTNTSLASTNIIKIPVDNIIWYIFLLKICL